MNYEWLGNSEETVLIGVQKSKGKCLTLDLESQGMDFWLHTKW